MPPIRLQAVAAARDGDEAKARRAELYRQCRQLLSRADGQIAGFALVLWDREGNLWSAYEASGKGPIGPALVPTLVSDALNRHVAVDLVRYGSVEKTGG